MKLADAEVVRELVAHDHRHEPPQHRRVAVAVVAQQRVAEDHDPGAPAAVGDGGAHVDAVSVVAGAVVGDRHGEVALKLDAQELG